MKPENASSSAAIIEDWTRSSNYQAVAHPSAIRSIVLLKVDHIGDFFLSFDALIALREAFPDARMHLVCAPWNVEIARSLRFFERILPIRFFDKRADGRHPHKAGDAVEGLPEERYDLAIDLRIDPDTRVLLRQISATFKAGFQAPGFHDMMVLAVPFSLPPDNYVNIGIHQSLLMLRLAHGVIDLFAPRGDRVGAMLLSRVATPCGIDFQQFRGRHVVVCNTSSGRAVKNWPFERFRNLIRWIACDLDLPVILTGTKDQASEAADVIAHCASTNVLSAVGRTDMRQAVDLVARASLFIGNDSALTHAAARLGVHTIALFSGIDPPNMWAPIGRNITVLRAPVPCANCHILVIEDCRGGHACMLNISEASVRATVRKHLLYAPLAEERTGAQPGMRNDAEFLHWQQTDTEQVPQRYAENRHRYDVLADALPIKSMRAAFTANNENNRGDMNRFYALTLVFDQIIKESVEGDLAELGVYKGNTAAMLAELARRRGGAVYLLDTYEGFDAADLAGVDADKHMEFADTSLAEVQALVGSANVRYVKGFFPSTADQLPQDGRFALVHIDCDLYAPFVAALEFFYPRLAPGGFLIMHDYASLHWDGAERAVDEFFADKPESVVPLPDGSGTAIVRKARPSAASHTWYAARNTTGFSNAWIRTSGADAKPFLQSGWSEPEDWGVWGLGPNHQLRAELAVPPSGEMELTAETKAVLQPLRNAMHVDVYAGSVQVATWRYDETMNAGIRSAVIPRNAFERTARQTALVLEFRPSAYDSPHSHDPSHGDTRKIGMGLLRFRVRIV